MGYEFRMPSIKGTEREQLSQIRSYLYKFIPQLEWALNHIDSSPISNYVAPKTQRVVTNQTSSIDAEVTTKIRGNVNFAGEAWLNLGLADGVAESESNCGRLGGTGCYYRVCASEKHVYVAFNCAFTYEGSALQINATPIPEAYRPDRNVYAICATGGRSVARILVNNSGNILVDWIQAITTTESTAPSTVKWIDGYIDYWT